MRILLIHNYYQHRGGEDLVFEAECKLLESRGHYVETLIFKNTGIHSVMDKLKTGLGVIYNFNSASQLKTKVDQLQPDVIHIHNFFPLASPSLFFAANQAKIPTVCTLHNYRLICPGALLLRNNASCELCTNKGFPLDSMIYKCYRNSTFSTASVALMSSVHKVLNTWNSQVDHYIALSQFSKSKFINSSLNLSDEKISVKPNFVLDPGYEFKNRQEYVVYVGRLSEEKGISVLLEAFQNISRKLKIVGSGPLEDLVIRASEKSSNIEFMGYQETDKVINILKNSQALVFPSICYENFPLAIAEALATGTPVIASQLGGAAEIVEDGINGLYFEPGNAEDLQKKLNMLLKDDLQYQVFANNARKTYLEKYTPEQNYQKLVGIYEHVISQKSAKAKKNYK